MSIRKNGPGIIILETFLFVCLSASVKAIAPRIPLAEIIFFRSLLPTVIFAVLLKNQGIPFRTDRFSLMMSRCLAGLLAMGCKFYSLGRLALGDSSVLGSTFPLFAFLVSIVFFREKMMRGILFWSVAAFAGILLILKPQFNFFNYAGLVALTAALFVAVSINIIHQLRKTEPSIRITFYFSAVSTFIAFPFMTQNFVIPNSFEIFLLVLTGLLGTAGQFLVTYAYGLQRVSRLAPLSNIGPVFAFLLGLLFWNEVPTWATFFGSVLVVASCYQISRIKRPEPVVAE